MTIVVARNISDRMRGFLASTLVEIGIGVYAGARISKAVRERIWEVVSNWFVDEVDASVVFVWQESNMPGGIAVSVLGIPPIEFAEVDGLVLARR
jgi:CRISPR-associated protein Cas2